MDWIFVAVFAIIATLVAAVLLQLRRAPQPLVGPTLVIQNELPVEVPTHEVISNSDLRQVIGESLTFDEFINPMVRSTKIEEGVAQLVRQSAASEGVNLGNIVLQAQEVGSEGLLVTFNDTGHALLQKKDGVFKAVTVDELGRFNEIGNIDPIGAYLNKLAGGTAVVVSVAHLISAADLAKSTAKLLDKVDLLLALRSIDQFEDLRTYYDRLLVLLREPHVRLDKVEEITLEVARLRNRLAGGAEHLAKSWKPLVPKRGWWLLGKARERLDLRFVDKSSDGYGIRLDEYQSIAKRACLSQACWHLEEICWDLHGQVHHLEPQRVQYATRLRELSSSIKHIETDLQLENAEWSSLVDGLGSTIQRSWVNK